MVIKSVIRSSSSLTGESFESIEVDVSDSDSWQVIDPSDSDDDVDDVTVEDVTVEDDDVENVDDLLQHPVESLASDTSMLSLFDEIAPHCQELEIVHKNHPIIDYKNVSKDDEITHQFQEINHISLIINGGDEHEYEDEDDTHDDDYDLDDELVPKSLKNKFKRQRMRKLGKRISSKMKKSKRIANQINQPGCVRGKHGLGLKHNIIW